MNTGEPEAAPWAYDCPDKEVMVMQIIKTTLLRRGEGTQADPIRSVTQFWNMQGELLAEHDPVGKMGGSTNAG
jgi:hypothetical protein